MDENNSISQIELDHLNNMGIHNLRIFARQVGVKSPTSLKKSELIDLIVKIKTGEIAPNRTNMGRKPKSLPNYQYDTIQSDAQLNGICSFNSPMFEYDSQTLTRDGVLKFINNSAPIIKIVEKSNQVISIPIQPSIISKYNIKQNDIVTVEIMPIMNSYQYAIKEILAINGIDIANYNNDKFTSLLSKNNTDDYINLNYEKYKNVIGNTKIFKGSSNFFYYNDAKNIISFAYQFCNDIKEKDTQIILLNGNSYWATKSGISSNNNVEVVNLNIEDSYEELEQRIRIVNEKVKNTLLQGKQIIFVITELDDIFKIINYNITEVADDTIHPDSITALRRIVSIAKYIDEHQNSTLINFCSFSIKGKYKESILDDVLRYIDNYNVPNNI